MIYIILITIGISILLTGVMLPQILRVCYRKQIFDVVDKRKVHTNSIPRLGGMLFLPVMLIASGSALQYEGFLEGVPTADNFFNAGVLVGAFLVYLVGLVDDIFDLGAVTKFVIQIVAALVMTISGPCLADFSGFLGVSQLPVWFSHVATVFFILLLVNAMNLIDGIDGLAAALSLVTLATYAVVFGLTGQMHQVLICVALAGTIGVFMFYNMCGAVDKRTKIFMGDAGSLSLGYVMAFLALSFAKSEPWVEGNANLIVVTTPLVVPLLDLVRVAVTRLLQGKEMFAPDKQHIHHLFLAMGHSMHRTLLYLVLLQLGMGAVNMLLYFYGVDINLVLLADVVMYGAVILTVDR